MSPKSKSAPAGAKRADRRRFAIGCDLEGQPLKEKLIALLREDRHSVKDCGLQKADTADLPEIAALVSQAILGGDAELGILIGGSGPVASIAANKIPGIRACHCQDTVSVRQARRVADANVLCLGVRVMGDDLAAELTSTFVDTPSDDSDRNERLRRKIGDLEEGFEGRREILAAQATPSD